MTLKGIGSLQSLVLVLGPYIRLHTECGRRHVRMSGNTSQHDDDDDDNALINIDDAYGEEHYYM